ncbi:MAG: J domain-containing protein [Bacteriovoracaceae bacterium]
MRMDSLILECLSTQSLRNVLKKSHLSVLGDEQEKSSRVANGLTEGEIRFREDFLHIIDRDELRDFAYQVGFEASGPLWQLKDELCLWFDQSFDQLKKPKKNDLNYIHNREQLIDVIEQYSLNDLQSLCWIVENQFDPNQLLYNFSEFDSSDEGLCRLETISSKVLQSALEILIEQKEENTFRSNHLGHESEDHGELDLEEAYEVFGLSPRESNEIVKRRYFELMKQYHPDTNSTDETLNLRYHQVRKAFDIIKEARFK